MNRYARFEIERNLGAITKALQQIEEVLDRIEAVTSDQSYRFVIRGTCQNCTDTDAVFAYRVGSKLGICLNCGYRRRLRV